MSAKVLTLPVPATDERTSWERAAVNDVRRLRPLLGTREQAARLLGCSDDSLGCWERGEKRVPGWVIKALTALTSEVRRVA
jgi:hypothetical protein